mmetsp:Transcript_20746/g.47096  ORF Transcript_20746/g.47096 Transcript_20746/m.47096 type:complete len:227 (-) Transcript_20746:492-1172(-)
MFALRAYLFFSPITSVTFVSSAATSLSFAPPLFLSLPSTRAPTTNPPLRTATSTTSSRPWPRRPVAYRGAIFVPHEGAGASASALAASAEPPEKSNPETAPVEITLEQRMALMGTNPRRIFVSLLSSSLIALGGNFFGVTSNVLKLLPEDTVESSGLDLYYPRGEFKRYRNDENGYSFVYPKTWVGDTSLELEKARRKVGETTYTMSKRSGAGVLPDAERNVPHIS